MPSASLTYWTTERTPRLAAVDAQCAASLAAVPAAGPLADENLRGYVVLLSAHFQGFCRDLYTEAAQVVVSKVRPKLRPLIEEQFLAQLGLNHGNPTAETLARDFGRFQFHLLPALALDPANALRRQHLAALNKWRNVAAHRITPTPEPLSLPLIRVWRESCDGLAVALDGIMYHYLRASLRRKPWR